MFNHRDFLYRRSQNGAHLGLAARLNPSLVPDQAASNGNGNPSPAASPASSSPSPNSKSSDSLTPLSPVAPASKSSDDPTTPSSSSPLPSPTPSTSSTSSSASSSTQTSSSSSPSSSATSSALSTIATSLVAAPATSTHASLATSKAVSAVSFTPTSSISPSTTSSPGTSSGVNTGAIIGGIAGTLAGIAILGFFLMWCMRRQRNRDIDDFDAQAFKRQSAILVDDPVEPSRSYNPRPPTMIERHNASPALAAQSDYGGQNFYGNYGGYGQQAPQALEMSQSTGSSPPQAYGAPPAGYAGYSDSRQQIARQASDAGYAGYNSIARQPSNAEYLTRQPTSGAGYAAAAPPPGAIDQNASYIDLNRSSVSPYQAAQYADISRRLGAVDPNEHVPREAAGLPDGPLPSPFDDPVETTQGVPAAHVPDAAAHSQVIATSAPQPQGNAAKHHQRPDTVYEEGDAYDGI